jgi:hypothetical protein
MEGQKKRDWLAVGVGQGSFRLFTRVSAQTIAPVGRCNLFLVSPVAWFTTAKTSESGIHCPGAVARNITIRDSCSLESDVPHRSKCN